MNSLNNKIDENIFLWAEHYSKSYKQCQEAIDYRSRISQFKKIPLTSIDIVLDRAFIINYLVKKYNYKSYLEIGCNLDDTFSKVLVENKVGVDPNSGGTIRLTADDFFEKNDQTFDIIFIDGLHKDYQVIKDVENSLQVLNKNGTIVLHDCKPLLEDEAQDDEYESRSGIWNGTVWKALIYLKSLNDIDIRVLDCDWGIGIVRKQTNTQKIVLKHNYKKLTWRQYKNNFDTWINSIFFSDLNLWLVNYKILFFITSHRQVCEINYCADFFNLFSYDLIKNSDIILYCNNINISEEILNKHLNKFPQKNKQLIHTSKNWGYLLGALEMLSDSYELFKNYDYVVSINPDVYITDHNKLLNILNKHYYDDNVFIVERLETPAYSNNTFQIDHHILKPKLLKTNVYQNFKNKDLQNQYNCHPEKMFYSLIVDNNIKFFDNGISYRGNRKIDPNGIWHCHDNGLVFNYLKNLKPKKSIKNFNLSWPRLLTLERLSTTFPWHW